MLRNKVRATTAEQLRTAENDLLEYRLAELRERPGLATRTYDLAHLKALRHQLLQDVYEWVGELRTVGLAKGEGEDTSVMPPFEIERPVAHVAARIAETDRLRNVDTDGSVAEVTYLYDYLNFVHPFREGNRRAQREFFVQYWGKPGGGWRGSESSRSNFTTRVISLALPATPVHCWKSSGSF